MFSHNELQRVRFDVRPRPTQLSSVPAADITPMQTHLRTAFSVDELSADFFNFTARCALCDSADGFRHSGFFHMTYLLAARSVELWLATLEEAASDAPIHISKPADNEVCLWCE